MKPTPISFFRLRVAALGLLAACGAANAAVIYSNGPVVNGSGISVLTSPATTFGTGAQTFINNRVADDFTVGAGKTWNLSSIGFFSYQTGSTGFTFQNAAWSIVSGDVNTGSVVASGVTALTNAGLVGYRVFSTTLTDTQRPIYRAEADIADISLAAGDYWLRWSLTGSLTSGPFIPPTSDGKIGNAAQALGNNNFQTLVDPGSQLRGELPFELNGTVSTSNVPEPSGIALLGLGLVGLAATRRKRLV